MFLFQNRALVWIGLGWALVWLCRLFPHSHVVHQLKATQGVTGLRWLGPEPLFAFATVTYHLTMVFTTLMFYSFLFLWCFVCFCIHVSLLEVPLVFYPPPSPPPSPIFRETDHIFRCFFLGMNLPISPHLFAPSVTSLRSGPPSWPEPPQPHAGHLLWPGLVESGGGHFFLKRSSSISHHACKEPPNPKYQKSNCDKKH